jgi:septal ring-binding cell division protein DamX
MAASRKRGAGERVLEGRHVIGLFLLMLVFSGVFFALGYVMGRSQYDGQVRASTTSRNPIDAVWPDKTEPGSKPSLGGASAGRSTSRTAVREIPPADSVSEWDSGSAEKPRDGGEHLTTPAMPAVSSAPKNSQQVAVNTNRLPAISEAPKTSTAGGAYSLQVTAVRRESDALDLARRLQKKKFSAFVLPPQGNKFYRVQVGPYSDLKSAEAAKKGLESAGFRAIVKRG